MRTSVKLMQTILNTKYEKENLNKVVKEKFQHLIEDCWKDLIQLLHMIEYLFGGTLGKSKTEPVKF